MHHLPVQRNGPLSSSDHELLELCADGWSSSLIAEILGFDRETLAARLGDLCDRLGVTPRGDGSPPVHAARLWLIDEAREASATRAA
jgi:DNA-binding CsgD family transcriptional regulator